ncbi:hypothetical protein ACEN9X_09430 [Mucilaginibacter sp. Mucisp86]|uniref:hypothetical protein n=1 Tax=Mucilaginibacter sp. Mucisp86 TaxID=3243060 RepID=UPI0039B38119
MKIILYIIGLVLIALSVYGRYWRGRRIFERRNIAGIQEFKSYNDSLKKTYFENLMHFLGVFSLVLGIIVLLFAYFGYDDFLQWMQTHQH